MRPPWPLQSTLVAIDALGRWLHLASPSQARVEPHRRTSMLGVGTVQSVSKAALTCLCLSGRCGGAPGRDRHVFATDLKTMESTCLLRTRDPVLKLALAPDNGLWVSMTNSDIELWHADAALQVEAATCHLSPGRLLCLCLCLCLSGSALLRHCMRRAKQLACVALMSHARAVA